MDQAKRDRVQREADPLSRLWQDLALRVVGPDAGGFAGLDEREKQYFAVGLLVGDVYNGGFDQYFFNSSAAYYEYALVGLQEMGATNAYILLRRAKQVLFGFRDVPTDTARRRALIAAAASQPDDERVQTLDELFWADPDGLQGRSLAFARRYGLD